MFNDATDLGMVKKRYWISIGSMLFLFGLVNIISSRGLSCIYTTSEILVCASKSELGCNQNNWIDVSSLHWPESMSEILVLDICVRACPYM